VDATASEPPRRGWLLLRWLLVPAGIWFGWALGVSFRVSLPNGTGRVWGDLIGTFAIEALVVLAAAALAPTRKLIVALVIGSLGVLFRRQLVGFEDSLLGLLLGGTFSVLLVAAIAALHQRRWLAGVVALIASVSAAVICSEVADSRIRAEEATPDEVPHFIRAVLEDRWREIRAVYDHNDSFMMTTLEVCRVDASPELLELLIARLNLRKIDALPSEFWDEPLSYWPHGLPPGGECFARESNIDTGDSLFGDDHEVCFLLYDKPASRVFISYYASL